ncbi:MAG: glycoside hydrolase family 13 protein [Microscillaceae bacterium]|nr:glycoside hydrolase family 13 protein [Microscillaceae bacterium]
MQAQYKIDRLEPSFWWVGMKNPTLQLLVYGKNINQLNPQINYPGVQIEQTIQVQNPNYLFINLHISPEAKAGKFLINFQKDGKNKLVYEYQLLTRKPGSSERIGFKPSDVMYLITPDRFANALPDNDSHPAMSEKLNRSFPGGRHGGDIQGISDHLDYIKDMGFTAVWLNPVLENNQPEYSYHGYATTDFYKVDPRFGTNEDYRKLAELAQSKGIKMIMDMIANHCGSEHWWIKDLPTPDWINYKGQYHNTNHRRTIHQDPYVSSSDSQEFVDGWFVKTMPDMNQRNPLMATYLIQNTIWWIEYVHLAGIRMDTYPYPDKDFMSEWTCKVLEEYPDFNIVGEEWTDNPAIVSFWQRGKVNANGYTSCLPGLMDFPIQASVSRGLNNKEEHNSGFAEMYHMLSNDFLYPEPQNLVVFPDNHDMDRFFTQVKEDLGLFKLGIAYFLTIRGIPQIYYGTEILMVNKNPGDHSEIRTDFPGGWAGDAVNAFTGQGLSPQQMEARNFMKKLLNWRKNAQAIHQGKLMHFAPIDGVYVFFRYLDTQKIMVILNKNTSAKTLNPARFQEILKGVSQGTDIISGQEINLTQDIQLNPKTPLVIEIK